MALFSDRRQNRLTFRGVLQLTDGPSLTLAFGRPPFDERARNVGPTIVRPSGGGTLKPLARAETNPEFRVLRVIVFLAPVALELGPFLVAEQASFVQRRRLALDTRPGDRRFILPPGHRPLSRGREQGAQAIAIADPGRTPLVVAGKGARNAGPEPQVELLIRRQPAAQWGVVGSRHAFHAGIRDGRPIGLATSKRPRRSSVRTMKVRAAISGFSAG